MKNLMVGGNKTLLFNFSEKKRKPKNITKNKLYFHGQKALKDL